MTSVVTNDETSSHKDIVKQNDKLTLDEFPFPEELLYIDKEWRTRKRRRRKTKRKKSRASDDCYSSLVKKENFLLIKQKSRRSSLHCR